MRNEKALQELVKVVPGNDRCADCGARNPGMLTASPAHPFDMLTDSSLGWASWSVSSQKLMDFTTSLAHAGR